MDPRPACFAYRRLLREEGGVVHDLALHTRSGASFAKLHGLAQREPHWTCIRAEEFGRLCRRKLLIDLVSPRDATARSLVEGWDVRMDQAKYFESLARGQSRGAE